MRRLSERRRRLAAVVVVLGGAGVAVGHSFHAHRMGTLAVGLVVVVQVWAFVLMARTERKEGL
jgi:hypothetical protein